MSRRVTHGPGRERHQTPLCKNSDLLLLGLRYRGMVNVSINYHLTPSLGNKDPKVDLRIQCSSGPSGPVPP